MRYRGIWLLGALAAARVLAACGSSDATWPSNEGPGGFRDAGARSDIGASSDTGAAVDTGLPPEREERRTFQTPQAGGRYVYVANPTRDTVAVIDSRTLAIQTVEAGDRPTWLVTLSGRDTAIVLNVGSDNATILRTTEAGTRTSFVPVARGANAIAVAPDGTHAVVYLDTDAPNADVTSGSFQDVTVITLEDGRDRAVQLSVGFRPVDVTFTADGATAFVVTEDGISILRFADITGPAIIPNVALSDTDVPVVTDAGVDAGPPDAGGGDASVDATADATADGSVDGSVDATADAARPPPQGPVRDVSITPDGRYALARVEGSSVVRLVDLTTRAVTSHDLGAVVTDLDIAPSGAFALAILRDASTVLRLPLPGFRDPATVQRIGLSGEVVGSVAIAPDGARALLYTTAAPIERLTVLELGTTVTASVLRLRKAIRAVAFAPDSRTALVVHTRSLPGDPNDPTADLETRIDRSYGYTLVEPSARFAKLQLTPVEVGPFAIVPDGAYGFVLLRDDARSVAQVHRISMRSFAVQTISLGSPPSSVGAVPSTERVFIGQDHPEGRITFVEWGSGALQSVTGFELNSRIVM